MNNSLNTSVNTDSSVNNTTLCSIALHSLVSGEDMEAAYASSKFQDWLARASQQFDIKKITFESVNFFGPLMKDCHGKNIPKSNVAFIKFIADVSYGGFPVPGIVFMRGGCVAVFIVVTFQNVDYALLVRQARFAIANTDYLECCAGIINPNGTYTSAAAAEVYEETGIQITDESLADKHLGSIYPSPGGCDEVIEVFYYNYAVETKAEFDSLQGRATGNLHENERIKCALMPLEAVNDPKICQDPKAIVAYSWYKAKFNK